MSIEVKMSALGHKRTFRIAITTSALPPKADIGTCQLNVRSYPKSGHGVAPSEQMSFAIAAMASGRGPGEDRVGRRCVPQPKFCSLGVRMILFDLGETQSRRSRPGSCRRSPCAPC